MSFSRDDILKVARLARLELPDADVDRQAEQLAQILEYVQQLERLDTDDVEPLAHPLEVSNVLRPDDPTASLPRERVLRNAPSHDDECFRVPAVLGDE